MKKIIFKNGTVPALSAENMNKLQDNIEAEINKNIDDINNIESNSYFIGRYTQNVKFEPTGDHLILLSPDNININNMIFENNVLTINEDGLYYINVYIRLDRGCRRSFIDISVTDGGPLSPTVVRSQDTQNMWNNESAIFSGDPTYELNRPVYLKKGAKLNFGFWNSTEVSITGGEDFDANSSCISVIKIGNYPSEVSNENN